MLAASDWLHRYFRTGLPAGIGAMGIWAFPPGRAELVASWSLHQNLLNIAYTCERNARDLLLTGNNLALTEDITALPLLSPGHELLGLMLVEGKLPRRGSGRTAFEAVRHEAALAVRPPLPLCGPEMLVVPVKDLHKRRGRNAVWRRLAEVLLRGDKNLVPLTQVAGARRVILPRRAGEPRQPLVAYELQPLLELAEAREMEHKACREVLGQCDGDLHMSAGLLRLESAVWRVYLEGVGLLVPPAARRPADGH